VVMLRWGWSFFTSGRGTRLITGSPQLPPIEEPAPPASSSTVVPADDTGQDGSTSDYRR